MSWLLEESQEQDKKELGRLQKVARGELNINANDNIDSERYEEVNKASWSKYETDFEKASQLTTAAFNIAKDYEQRGKTIPGTKALLSLAESVLWGGGHGVGGNFGGTTIIGSPGKLEGNKPDILKPEFANIKTINVQALGKGDGNKSQYTKLPHEEMVDLGFEKSEHVLKVHLRMWSFKLEDEKTNKVKYDTLSPAHIFLEKVDLNTGKSSFFGSNPSDFNYFYTSVAKNSDTIERTQYNLAVEFMQQTGKQVLYTKVVYLDRKNGLKVDKLADMFNYGNNEIYSIGLKDCTDLGQRVFDEIGRSADYGFLFTKDDLSWDESLISPAATQKLRFIYGTRNSDHIVRGSSIKEIAQKYNVSEDRVVKVHENIAYGNREIPLGLNGELAYLLKQSQDKKYRILPREQEKK